LRKKRQIEALYVPFYAKKKEGGEEKKKRKG
jgi:hypothetical protein